MTTTPHQKQKPFISSDIWEAAFFAYRGLNPKLQIHSNRVFFVFTPSSELYQSLSDYNSHTITVNLAKYIESHKHLKTAMMRFREEAGQ